MHGLMCPPVLRVAQPYRARLTAARRDGLCREGVQCDSLLVRHRAGRGRTGQKSGLGRLGAFPRVGEGLKGNSWVRLYPVGS